MQDSISLIANASKAINNSAITLTRCLILTYLSYSIDGLQYRELKTILGVSDGKLISNLKKLVTFDYIKKTEVELDNKKLDVYMITENGKRELKKIIDWMSLISAVANVND